MIGRFKEFVDIRVGVARLRVAHAVIRGSIFQLTDVVTISALRALGVVVAVVRVVVKAAPLDVNVVAFASHQTSWHKIVLHSRVCLLKKKNKNEFHFFPKKLILVVLIYLHNVSAFTANVQVQNTSCVGNTSLHIHID